MDVSGPLWRNGKMEPSKNAFARMSAACAARNELYIPEVLAEPAKGKKSVRGVGT